MSEVIPAKAGIQYFQRLTLQLDSPVKLGNDEKQTFSALSHNKKRNVNGLVELGFDLNRPIREQKSNPLSDRKALDDIVFYILGLTQQGNYEVNWSVCELVKNRLTKAESLKPERRGDAKPGG